MFISISSYPTVLMYILPLKYVLPTHTPLSAQKSTSLPHFSFSHETPDTQVMSSPTLSPSHSFRSPINTFCIHYLVYLAYPSLSRTSPLFHHHILYSHTVQQYTTPSQIVLTPHHKICPFPFNTSSCFID